MTIYNTWIRENCEIREVDCDADRHTFEVFDTTGNYMGVIDADDADQTREIASQLNNGEDIEGWEDGHGNTIDFTPGSSWRTFWGGQAV